MGCQAGEGWGVRRDIHLSVTYLQPADTEIVTFWRHTEIVKRSRTGNMKSYQSQEEFTPDLHHS
jgi:hypothetical protein